MNMSTLIPHEHDNGRRSSLRRWKEEYADEENEDDRNRLCFIVSMAVVGMASILIPTLYFWKTMGATLVKAVHSDKMAFGVLMLMILLSLIMGFMLVVLAVMNAVEFFGLFEGEKSGEAGGERKGNIW